MGTKLKQINYAVGHYWKGDSGSIGTYRYFNDVHYGTLREAKKFLKYVKGKSPQIDWKIFELVELKD